MVRRKDQISRGSPKRYSTFHRRQRISRGDLGSSTKTRKMCGSFNAVKSQRGLLGVNPMLRTSVTAQGLKKTQKSFFERRGENPDWVKTAKPKSEVVQSLTDFCHLQQYKDRDVFRRNHVGGSDKISGYTFKTPWHGG